MKDKLRNYFRTKMGKILCAFLIFFIVATSAFGMAVTVTNYQMLMPMIQKMVTQVITQKIQSVWNEEVRIKLEAGKLNTKVVTFLNYDMSPAIKNMVSDYMVNDTGAFSTASGKLYNDMAKSKAQLSLPLAGSDFLQFQKKAREVSILIAGAPGGGTAKMKHFSTADFAALKLRDVFNQASVAAYQRAAHGTYVAEKFRSELSAFSPSAFDSGKSDQAVKDLAKLTYYNAMLQSEILAVISQGEMRQALEGK
ncbi:MAG: hypothetical protein H6Q52_2071 [Deltaproteobacteria bacterium]|nr:hypothetical protein [Deltaproteobacteria bacterium]